MANRAPYLGLHNPSISNEEMKEILESGIFDPNSNDRGFNALHNVGKFTNEIMNARITLLLNHGVDINMIETINDGNTPLHTFVANERFEGLKFMINEAKRLNIKINFNLQDKQGKNCLILAAKMRQEHLALFLLDEARDKNFNVNLADENKMTALHYACSLGMPRLVNALLERNADTTLENDKKRQPLDCTVMNDKEIEAILRSVCIEPSRDEFAIRNNVSDSSNQSLFSLESGFPELKNIPNTKNSKVKVEKLLKQTLLDSAYLHQVQKMKLKGDAAITELKKHPMPQSEKDFILRQFDKMSGVSCGEAARRDQSLVQDLLIKHNANYGFLFRFYAAAAHKDLSKLLALPTIKNYINLPGIPSGKTALHQAAANGHLEVCRQLIKLDADKNAQDSNEDTPIMLAAAAKKRDVVLELASLGVDVKIRNKAQKNIFDVLRDTKQEDVILALLEKLANVNNATVSSEESIDNTLNKTF